MHSISISNLTIVNAFGITSAPFFVLEGNDSDLEYSAPIYVDLDTIELLADYPPSHTIFNCTFRTSDLKDILLSPIIIFDNLPFGKLSVKNQVGSIRNCLFESIQSSVPIVLANHSSMIGENLTFKNILLANDSSNLISVSTKSELYNPQIRKISQKCKRITMTLLFPRS